MELLPEKETIPNNEYDAQKQVIFNDESILCGITEKGILNLLDNQGIHDINREDGTIHTENIFVHWSELYTEYAKLVTEWHTKC